MGSYSWLTYPNAQTQLAARLSDPNNQKWSLAELGIYITEALRTWNALTLTWKIDYTYTPTVSWQFLGAQAGSPRFQTVTQTNLMTTMEYHLGEPPSGLTWEGTAQFTAADLLGALQRRRDEIILAANTNEGFLQIQGTPNFIRLAFPDTALEPHRIQWIGLDPLTGDPLPTITLYRDDKLAVGYFDPTSYTAPAGTPSAWLVSAEPPLSFDVDTPPATEGYYYCLVLLPGPTLSATFPTLIGLPDDFTWVAKWGAMADLLGRESEATDRARAEYCESRYKDGLKLLANTPWIFLSRLNGIVYYPFSIDAMDRYAADPTWDSDPNFTGVVIGGIDTIWTPIGQGLLLNVLGNAPVPVEPFDYIQCSRASWDAVLSYAQFLATFKLGGAEFQEALSLEAVFLKAAAKENDRLEELGLFSDVLVREATDEQRNVERYSQAGQS